jgi:glycosyltransferase involved in cell wall biosynthesis
MIIDSWAIIAPNDNTGLGRMAQDMKAVLGIEHHLIPPTSKLPSRPLKKTEFILDPKLSSSALEKLLSGFKGIIFFERNDWHPYLLIITRRLGIKTICVPMWEWFRGRSNSWINCDYFACPNQVCLDVVRSYGYYNSSLVTWPLDISRLPSRQVQGKAQNFIHNGGLIDQDDRKGTRDVINAFRRIKSDHPHLKVRLQKPSILPRLDNKITLEIGNLLDPGDLYRTGDVFIQPSKLEGIGFMVLEAIACGLPVITLNIPPLNEWGNQSELLINPLSMPRMAYSSAWIEHSCLRISSVNAITDMINYSMQIDLDAISKRNKEWALKTFNRQSLIKSWSGVLELVEAFNPMPEYSLVPDPKMPCNRKSFKLRKAFDYLVKMPCFRFF